MDGGMAVVRITAIDIMEIGIMWGRTMDQRTGDPGTLAGIGDVN